MRTGVAAGWRSGSAGGATPPSGTASPKEAECRRLLDALSEARVAVSSRRYEAGMVIYREGEEADALYVLLEGAVRVRGERAGYGGAERATMRLVGPWEVFGYPVFAGRSRGACAEAFSGCEAVKVPRPSLERAIRRKRRAALALAGLLESALVDQGGMVGCLLPRKTEARLARLLPLLLEKFGEAAPEERRAVGLRLTRRDLAEMVGSTRESVTVAVRRMREGGILEMERGRVVVLDPGALAEIGGR